MPDAVVLYDQFNHPIEMPKRPDGVSQASIGERVDRWSNSPLREISPELYTRVMQPLAPLWEKNALCERCYSSAHFFAIGSDRASTIGGWDWSVQPFTDSPGAKAKPDDVAVAESIAEKIYGTENFSAYLEHLAWGELFFLRGAETIWDTSTYLPIRFELVDSMRLNWFQNQATILTEENPRTGEPLKPGNWTVHSLNLQNPAKSPLARANLFFYLLTTFGVVDYAALSDKYGKPIPIGYFTDESQRDALIEALMMIGDQYVGAFPIGTKIDLTAALAATKDIVEGLCRFGYDQSTKATCGHVLIVEAKSGSGTLASKGAQMTNQKVARGVANRVGDNVRAGLIKPLTFFHHGSKFLSRLPSLQFKSRNPVEDKANADSVVAWNAALEPLGLAIDGEWIREQAGVPTLVKRVAPVAIGAPAPSSSGQEPGTPPAQPKGDSAATDDTTDTTSDEPTSTTAESEQRMRSSSQSDRAPKVRTVMDVIATSAMVDENLQRSRAAAIRKLAEQAIERGITPAVFRDELLEYAAQLDTSASAEILTQGMAVADAMATANAATRAGK